MRAGETAATKSWIWWGGIHVKVAAFIETPRAHPTPPHLVVDGPCALQELPVRGPRGEVEGAGEDEQLAALGAHDHGELCVGVTRLKA